MTQNKFEFITLKLMSYNNIRFRPYTRKIVKRNVFKDFRRLLLLIWISLRSFTFFTIKFRKLKTYQKFYVVVKGPKCHKKGKHILKYTYKTSEIIIKKKINLNKNLYNITDYFFSIIDVLREYDSNYNANNKIILNTYINI